MKIKLEQWKQDLIYACKGRYINENETHLDGVKRVVENIIGGNGNELEIYAINHWLHSLYMELFELEGTQISRSNLKDYILGNTYEQRNNKGKTSQELACQFFMTEIQMCRVRGVDYDLILEFNEDIMTEKDKLEVISKQYEAKYDYENNIAKIFKNGLCVWESKDESTMVLYDKAKEYINEQSKRELELSK